MQGFESLCLFLNYSLNNMFSFNLTLLSCKKADFRKIIILKEETTLSIKHGNAVKSILSAFMISVAATGSFLHV